MFTLKKVLALASLIVLAACLEAGANHLMRFADVHDDRVVFTYEGDVWIAPVAGGDARRITNDWGEEQYAKFSPDGSKIAFTANYDGGTDVYVMDAGGGVPTRLTWHPASDSVLDWFPDGKSILFRSRRNYPFRADQIYSVSVEGGTEQLLPVDRAGLTAISPDGTRIAYNRISREFATWKKYQGGMAADIWMGSLAEGDFRPIMDWPGTDSYPMWQGEAIYFTSDRQHGRLNLYRYHVGTGQVTPLTDYRDYDVKYPSIGPAGIVFQYAESLHLLSPADGRVTALDIRIPSDKVLVREAFVDPSEHVGAFSLSPSGKRALIESRGEILNLPVEAGEPVNLTESGATRERCAAWSPEGRRIAFISDKSGEEELYIADQAAASPWKHLTTGGKGFRMQPVWSPDGKWLLFSDKSMRLNLVAADSGQITTIDQGEYDDGWERWGIQDYTWSPDSRWIAYTKMTGNLNEIICLYSMEQRKAVPVTDSMFTSFSPSFDPKGRYLYFLSDRTFAPIMCRVDQNHAFLDLCRPYVVILTADAESPFAPRNVAEDAREDTKGEESAAKEKKQDDEKSVTVQIDMTGLARRTLAVEGVPAGNYFRLEATSDGFLYLKKNEHEFLKYQAVTDRTGGKLDLYHYNIEEKKAEDRKPAKILEGISNYHLSADGKKLIYKSDATLGVVDSCKEAKAGDGKLDLARAKFKIDRLDEYRQIFDEAWRVQRDWFYDPNMHGVDWKAVGDMYRRFLPDCGTRSDLTYLIGEMIGELNAGHTYSYGGDTRDHRTRVSTGLLGADFDVPTGSPYYRITHIVPGSPWEDAERSPLAGADSPVREGHFLIAIDGDEIRSTDNVYRFLENKVGRAVEITFNERPTKDGARTYRTVPVAGEEAIRYREWVEKNRAYVDSASGGQIGYLHIPDMMEHGLIEFAKGFYPQHDRKALIIDDRYNTGGFVGDMIIDRLERRVWALTQPREGKVSRNPERAFHGHLAVIVNEDTGSNGEYFAEAIKLKKLAVIIGKRTWGGAIGIEPHQLLVDGGTTTPPQFAPYGLSGQWLIEGRGVEPDIDVQNMPGDVFKGRDAQLDAAIEYLRKKIAQEPMEIPPTPPYPVKTQ
ncbi:MAG: hypothetical protein DCC65_08785 [Planctomycetota bacterium]|nr:MAG: hypothetical protein DCC65_08785 [Planctomycetota bacterium]